jgi:hypothetical protein
MARLLGALLAAVLLCVGQVADGNAQTQGRGEAPRRPIIPTTGTASVSGTVVAEGTGILLANARVTLLTMSVGGALRAVTTDPAR